ncbi:hypothetical protein B0H10DRAFT_2126813, partial [Mycena sp. CBHHK59/15]
IETLFDDILGQMFKDTEAQISDDDVKRLVDALDSLPEPKKGQIKAKTWPGDWRERDGKVMRYTITEMKRVVGLLQKDRKLKKSELIFFRFGAAGPADPSALDVLTADPVPEPGTASASIVDVGSISDEDDDADIEPTVVLAPRTDQLVVEIMAMIPLVQNDVKALATVLATIGVFVDKKTPGVWIVRDRALWFTGKEDKKKYADTALNSFAPIRDFFDKRSNGNTDNAMFSIGVALFPVRVDDKERETPVGKETGRRYASLHANLILIIHPQKSGAPGKAITVGEPNVIKLYSHLHPADSGDILEGRMNALLRAAFSRQKTSRKWIWIIKPRPERNDNGDCVELVLYWIMEMICNGVEIERSGGKVIGIKNFRKVPLRK